LSIFEENLYLFMLHFIFYSFAKFLIKLLGSIQL